MALALGIYSIVAALIFHHQTSQMVKRNMLLTDFAFAGGLFAVASMGGGRISLDGRGRA